MTARDLSKYRARVLRAHQRWRMDLPFVEKILVEGVGLSVHEQAAQFRPKKPAWRIKCSCGWVGRWTLDHASLRPCPRVEKEMDRGR